MSVQYKISVVLIILLLAINAATFLAVPASAQNDHMQMDDSTDIATNSSDAASSPPAIYEIPNSGIQVKLSWEPQAINTNETTGFTFEFIDADTEQHLQNVSFSVHMSLEGESRGHGHESTAPEGIGTIDQKFDSMGSLSIIVESIKVGNDTPIEGFAQFNLTVVPEFPVLFIGVIMSVAVMASMFASRYVLKKR